MTKVKGGNKIPEVKIFPVTLALEEIKKNISKNILIIATQKYFGFRKTIN